MDKVTCADLTATTLEDAKRLLDYYGVAIVPRVLDAEDCEFLLSKMWEFFEEICADMPVPLRRDAQETWPTLLDLNPAHGMLFQHWGVGQSEFAWWVRQHPRVVSVFAGLWRAHPDDLLVSFDGASFQAPPDRANNPAPRRGWGSAEPWWHVDQALTHPGFACVQGWVTALDAREDDATLAVMLGSHDLHNRMRTARNGSSICGA